MEVRRVVYERSNYANNSSDFFCSSASSFIDSGQKRHSSPSPPWPIGSVVWVGLLDDGLDILDELE